MVGNEGWDNGVWKVDRNSNANANADEVDQSLDAISSHISLPEGAWDGRGDRQTAHRRGLPWIAAVDSRRARMSVKGGVVRH